MKKYLVIFIVLSVIISCKKDEHKGRPVLDSNTVLTKIAFGACAYQTLKSVPIYDRMLELNPQLYIAGGDNVYTDLFAVLTGDSTIINAAYHELFFATPSWVEILKRIPILSTWDDHDTGQNDGTSSNPVKGIAKKAFFKFWEIAEDDPRHNRPDGGIYGSYSYGDEAHKVQIILLDLRWNHTKYKQEGPIAALTAYDSLTDPSATILGAEQWTWLESELRKPAKVRIIMSSLQFNTGYTGGENWESVPAEKRKMISLLKTTQANGVFFLSGDVHYAEFTKVKHPGLYPIYDFTSSGITHGGPGAYEINEPYRIGKAVEKNNIGLINIDWNATPVKLKFEIYGNALDLRPLLTHTVSLDELQF
jgi:alkaline phosphatase D